MSGLTIGSFANMSRQMAAANVEYNKAATNINTTKKIQSAKDDTSGYRVGKELEGRTAVMQAAANNVSAAKDILSTTETALSNINDLLNKIKGKAADANDPTKNLSSLANDVLALGDEINSIFTNTSFNGTALLSGGTLPSGGDFVFKTGENESTTINIGTMNTLDLGSITTSGTGAVTSATVASVDISSIQTSVQDAISKIGNYMQRLDVKDTYLSSAISNAQSSIKNLFEASIPDEMVNLTAAQLKINLSFSMFSSVNQQKSQLAALAR